MKHGSRNTSFNPARDQWAGVASKKKQPTAGGGSVSSRPAFTVPTVFPKAFHDAANDAATEIDGTWFGRHRWRRLYARPSIPRELASWGGLTHLQLNWVLVRVARNRRGKFTEYQRIGVSCPNELPDDEQFLERLWQRHEALKSTHDGKHYEMRQDEIRALTAGLEITDERKD